MKKLQLFLTLQVLFTLPSFAGNGQLKSPVLESDNWQKVAEKRIQSSSANETFELSNGGSVLSAFKIKTKKAGLNLLRCVVHFQNGEKRNLELRNDIPSGGESRVFQLPGNSQPVTRVVIWFEVSDPSQTSSELELWGKH